MVAGLRVAALLACLATLGARDIAAELQAIAVSDDVLVFVGAGKLGGWETQFELANPDADALGFSIGVTPEFPGACPPLIGCAGYESVGLPPFGSASTVTPGPEGLTTIYLRNTESDALPTVTAYSRNSDVPARAAPVPGYRLSTIVGLNAAPLTFPGAKAGQLGRSNLVLANLLTADQPRPPVRGGEVTLLIEAYSSAGELLGSMSQVVRAGRTVMIPQVFDELGGSAAEVGQVRVTRTAGDRVFWGVLYTFDQAGAVSASVSANP